MMKNNYEIKNNLFLLSVPKKSAYDHLACDKLNDNPGSRQKPHFLDVRLILRHHLLSARDQRFRLKTSFLSVK